MDQCPRCASNEIASTDNFCKVCGFTLFQITLEKVEVIPETAAATAASEQPKLIMTSRFFIFPDLSDEEIDMLHMALMRRAFEWARANGFSNK